MLSESEVKHIAKLARLGLTEKEVKKFQKELSQILDYIEKLKEVDINNVESTSHPIRVFNVMREDEPQKREDQLREKLMALAPETKNGYLKVKSILK